MIYDCFTFFNELDLLEIRLNTHNPHVDKFVLVESIYTFSGKKKPLYYDEAKNDERFLKFKDKINHIIVTDKPFQDIWKTEWYQKNCVERGLTKAKKNDTILFSDLDEIIRPEVLVKINEEEKHTRLILKLFYYYLNCQANIAASKGAAFCKFRDFKNVKYLRRPNHKINSIKNAGWHFSYLLTTEDIIKKIESFSHDEYNTDFFKDSKRILNCMENGIDLYNRKKINFTFEELDVPKYVEENIEKFSKYIRII